MSSHSATGNGGGDSDIVVRFGHDELIIRNRYEVASIVNDILIGIWFLVGSVLFLYTGELATIGIWLFIVGSIEMLIRPVIRLFRRIHLKRFHTKGAADAGFDY